MLVTDTFDSVDEMLTLIDTKPIQWESKAYSEAEGQEDFAGTGGFQEAMKLARYGWPEGLDKMSKSLEETTKLVNPYLAEQNYLDVCGAYPNVPAACAGAIENMVSLTSGSMRQKPVIKILVSVAAAASVDKTEIMNRGAAILSYVDMLENAGYPIEIEVYTHHAASTSYSARTIIKHAGTRLDIDRAAFCLAHPSYLRRVGFRLVELHKEVESDLKCGYGNARSLPATELKDLRTPFVHFGTINPGDCRKADQAVKIVKQQIISQITSQGYELPALTPDEGAMSQTSSVEITF